MSAAEIVKKIRLGLGLEQTELAEKLECGTASISHWERGTRKPRLPTIRKIVEFAKKNKMNYKIADFLEE